MIFKSLRLKNFRQYSKEIEIKFSIPKDGMDNITLIMAENGVGKTTLLQSIRYCFFGSQSNYLRLPNKNELINNTLKDRLRELEETKMFVEVEFEHESVSYIARREESFERRNSRIVSIGEEIFSLKEHNETSGYQSIPTANARDKMNNIMPDGLSYIFMFDGERMERNISDKEFKNDLKDSILGMLNIKQYDELITLLGSKGKSSTVIGKINGMKTAENQADKDIVEKSLDLENYIATYSEKVVELEDKTRKIEIQIKENEELQAKFEDLKVEQEKLKGLTDNFSRNDEDINNKSKELSMIYLWQLKDLLITKFSTDYYLFRDKSENSVSYLNLHIDTLNSILTSNVCLCGEDISSSDKKIKHIESLKEYALPFEMAHHLSTIVEQIEQSKENISFDHSIINNEIMELKLKSQDINKKIAKQEEKMNNIEKSYKVDYGEVIKKLRDERDLIIAEKSRLNTFINNYDAQLKRNSTSLKRIDRASETNSKINDMVLELEKIKLILEQKLNDLNRNARKTLEQYFQESLSKVLQSNYTASIDEDYNINIYNESGIDVTEKLSTGENVIVSLSMINALIETSKNFRTNKDKHEKYGIIMDAALSNLDETHIYRVTKHNLLNIDQLIFLSFKKQLRDEMIDGIYDNVGLAYELVQLEKEGGIDIKNIDKRELVEYISQNRGD